MKLYILLFGLVIYFVANIRMALSAPDAENLTVTTTHELITTISE